MFELLSHWFTVLVYQPFLNLLVFFYWALESVTGGEASMGWAVILLTIAIRLLLLPQSISGIKNEWKRVKLLREVAQIEHEFQHDPIELQKRKKTLLKSNPGMVIGELINIAIQVTIALMLWRMFGTGLDGQDLHLLYPFLPEVPTPYNLTFMGIHLNESSLLMNLLLTLLLFIMETLSVMAAAPGSLNRSRAIKAQLLIPIVSFGFFYFMPAGKKLFVIVTVLFSIVLTIIRLIMVRFELYKVKQEEREARSLAQPPGEHILVETKE